MNRNSLYLMVSGGTSQPTAEYQERRAKLKNLECALASFELSSKAWHASTLEMGRTLDLLCDAFQALHNVDHRVEETPAPPVVGATATGHVVSDGSTSVGPETPQECSLYEDHHNAAVSSSETMVDALKSLKSGATTAFRAFAVNAQQDVTGPLFAVMNEFRLCETLRHRRNRAQEQFDVDESVLTKKRADYEKKGKQLSDSKKYTDLVVQREQSHDALVAADNQFHVAYSALMDSGFIDTRRRMTCALATNSATLFGLLNEHFASVAASIGTPPMNLQGTPDIVPGASGGAPPIPYRNEMLPAPCEQAAEAVAETKKGAQSVSQESLDFDGIDPHDGSTPPGTPSSAAHVTSGPPTDAV